MTDLEILKSSEFMVAHIEGVNANGEAFVNNYVAREMVVMVVLDANRIIIHTDDLVTLLAQAADAGLTFKEVSQP